MPVMSFNFALAK